MTGLLANGGGFLLVPVFVLVLGLTVVEAAGTSMVVVGILTIPTLATHWALGHIDWTVAAGFAAGLIPGAAAGARIAPTHLGRTAPSLLRGHAHRVLDLLPRSPTRMNDNARTIARTPRPRRPR